MSVIVGNGQFSDAEDDEKMEQEKDLEIEPSNTKPYNNRRGGGEEDEVYEHCDDSEEEDDDWWGDVKVAKQRGNEVVNKNINSTNKRKTSFQPREKQFGKFVNKIKLEKYEVSSNGGHAANNLNEFAKKQYMQTARVKDRKDRATVEQVLDPRTKMILFKLLNKGVISEINGCISTGKEANVYHASTSSGLDRAVKIYKTSILVFKDRDKYVSGEFRFRHGYCKGNPRKMVQTWAEKEMRNLLRLHSVGIPCPEPIILRNHVLVMDFIGHGGFPAPLLKDAHITESKARELYLQCVRYIRDIYWKAKLVHADLSEFNILYNIEEDKIYIIDVSQSVEHDHPRALLFLRKDCTNINDFFRKNQVCVLTVKELFDFVTDPLITDDNIEEYLERAQEVTSNRTYEEVTQKDIVDEEVFKNAYIPRRLDEVIDFERDSIQAQKGELDNVHYATIIGLNKDLTGAKEQLDIIETIPDDKMVCSAEDDTDTNSESSEEDDEDEEDEEENNEVIMEESTKSKKELRKENKKIVKEENREKRKEKMPKHVKKRKEKVTRGRKK